MPTTADYLNALKRDKDTLFDNLKDKGVEKIYRKGSWHTLVREDDFTTLCDAVSDIEQNGYYFFYPKFYDGTAYSLVPYGTSSILFTSDNKWRDGYGKEHAANSSAEIKDISPVVWIQPDSSAQMNINVDYTISANLSGDTESIRIQQHIFEPTLSYDSLTVNKEFDYPTIEDNKFSFLKNISIYTDSLLSTLYIESNTTESYSVPDLKKWKIGFLLRATQGTQSAICVSEGFGSDLAHHKTITNLGGNGTFQSVTPIPQGFALPNNSGGGDFKVESITDIILVIKNLQNNNLYFYHYNYN